MYCRALARFAEPRVAPRDIRSKRADPEVIDRAQARLRANYADRIFVCEHKKPTVSSVCELMRSYRYVRDVDLVVVDYLQAISEDEPVINKTQEMASVVSRLKRCATEVRVALVLMSQYNRESYKDGTEPGLNSCKYSGDIENEAEIMCLHWRDADGVLRAKLPKLKWSRTQDLRFTINVDETSGNHLGWEPDYSEED